MKWLLLALLFLSSFAAVCATEFYAGCVGKKCSEPYFAVSYSNPDQVEVEWAKVGSKKVKVNAILFNSLNVVQNISLSPLEGSVLVTGGGGDLAPRVEMVTKNGFKDITADCFYNVEATGDNKILLEYNPFCPYCKQEMRLKVGVSKGTEKDYFIQPIKIPCTADVLLVTDTRAFDVGKKVCLIGSGVTSSSPQACFSLPPEKKAEFGYFEALDIYSRSLGAAGLKFRYFDFAAAAANKINYGSFETPAKVSDWNAETSHSSKRYVPVVRKVLKKTAAKNVVILGGVTVIPMPFNDDEELTTAAEKKAFMRNYVGSRDGRLPSDDDYVVEPDTGLPIASVSRFPSLPEDPTAMYVALFRAAQLRGRAFESVVTRQSLVLVSDACGTPASPGSASCLLRAMGDKLSKTLFDKTCSGAVGKCFLSPPFCIGKEKELVGESCMPHPDLRNVLSTSAMVFVAHGNGVSFVAESGDQTYFTFSAAPITEVIREGGVLAQLRAVFSNSCYNGAIDRNAGDLQHNFYNVNDYSNSVALAFVRAGALAYVGRTRVSFYEDDFLYEFIRNFSKQGLSLGKLVKNVKVAGYSAKAGVENLRKKIASVEADREATADELDLLNAEINCAQTAGEAPGCSPTSFPDPEQLASLEDQRDSLSARLENYDAQLAALREGLPDENAERHRFFNVRELALYGDPFVKMCSQESQKGDVSCLN